MNGSHLTISALSIQGVPILLYLFPHMPADVAAALSTAAAAVLLGSYMVAQRYLPVLRPLPKAP